MRKYLFLFVIIGFSSLCYAAQDQATDSDKLQANSAPAETKYLNWEHSLTTRTSKSKYPVARLKIYNNWTPTQHRLLVKYNVLGMGAQSNWISSRYGPSFSMPDFNPLRITGKGGSYHHGTLGIVERLNDDRFIAYSSESGHYFIEPRRALMKRLRFDPWKKIAPELSKEDPPSFTPQQRARLGREVRSLVRPLIKDVFKSYFRALPEPRIFTVADEKITARGYRMTMLFNAGSAWEGEQWYRVNAEWWLAPGTPGDEVLAAYGARYIADLNQLHGLTTSMWMNETLPLLWEVMPQAMHQAVATFMPKGVPFGFEGDNAFRMSGAPVYAALTLMPPAEPQYARCPSCGEYHVPIPGTKSSNAIRLEMQLNRRDTRVLGQQLFEAPPEYKKDSLQPVLKEWDEGMEAIQGLFDEEVRLSDASEVAHQKPTYSWSAMRSVLRALRQGSTPVLK